MTDRGFARLVVLVCAAVLMVVALALLLSGCRS